MVTREQILINKVLPNLPIIVYPEREILPKLRENFEDESIGLKTKLEVHSMIDMREEGGIICEIRTIGLDTEKAKQVFLCSITHFKVKRGEPFYEDLEKYRIKRIRRLTQQNRNRFY